MTDSYKKLNSRFWGPKEKSSLNLHPTLRGTQIATRDRVTKPKVGVIVAWIDGNNNIWFWYCHTISKASKKPLAVPDTRDTPLHHHVLTAILSKQE